MSSTIRMEKLKIKRIRRIFTIIILIFTLGCTGLKSIKKQQCFNDQLNYIFQVENELKVHDKTEVLLVLNFFDIHTAIFKAAIIPKSIYPSYLRQTAPSNVRGYYLYDDIITLVYGEPPKFLSLKKVEDSMKFMQPAQSENPKKEILHFLLLELNLKFILSRKTVIVMS